MFSFLIPIIIISILILVHEFGHFIAAKKIGVKVERFSLGFGPKILRIKKNETIYQISAIPLGGYIKMAGDNWQEYKGKTDEFLACKPKERAKIIVSGAVLNYLLGLICFCWALVFGIPDSSSTVGETMEGYPAREVGMLTGDRIVSVDGQKVKFWRELTSLIHKKEGAKVNISLLRDGETIDLVVPTRLEKVGTPKGEQEISLIGIKPGRLKYGIKQAFIVGARDYLNATVRHYKTLGLLFIGKISFRRSVAGPIGIYYITSGAASMGLGPLLYVFGVINLALAVINLLPFPVLDGGHLALIVLEKIRGKRFKRNVEESIERVGLSLLILLGVFVVYNDIINFGIWENILNWFKSFR